MSPAVKAARWMLGRYWDRTLPVNPTAISYALGIRIVFAPDLDSSGFFGLDVSGKPIIHINPRDTAERQRFTVFHELGRYVLGGTLGHGRENDADEAAVGQFVVEMILPCDAVFLFAEGKKTIAQMAEIFAVSETAMRIRLCRLGLLAA